MRLKKVTEKINNDIKKVTQAKGLEEIILSPVSRWIYLPYEKTKLLRAREEKFESTVAGISIVKTIRIFINWIEKCAIWLFIIQNK